MQPESEIECSLNGELKTTKERISLADFLIEQGYQGKEFATAINGEFVPRSQYSMTVIGKGDLIDIVAPVTGG